MIVERTCTEIRDGGGVAPQREPRPLSDYRDCSAYVLLGGPGAGKTTAFDAEAAALGVEPIAAREFLTFDDRPQWHQETLFIDGLDEVQAGRPDGRDKFDAIRRKLDRLGKPRFRLSCREADWFGAADRERLTAVSADGTTKVLRLDPLSEEQVRRLLAGRMRDVDDFLIQARAQGIDELLGNPLDLELLAKAVAGGPWPKTRLQTLERACKQLVQEPSRERPQARPRTSTDEELLDAGGLLCAVALLAGKAGYSLDSVAPGRWHPSLSAVARRDLPMLKTAVETRLFTVEGGRAVPRHRHIAEFLGARYLAERVLNGLPPSRLFALAAGPDGRPVMALRGLMAWVAAQCPAIRRQAADRDALGTILYGDVRGFSAQEKRTLLECLERDAEADHEVFWRAQRGSPRFADLCMPEMEGLFRKVLHGSGGAWGKETVAVVVLQALLDRPMPGLVPELLETVRSGWQAARIPELALEAYAVARGEDGLGELKRLLDDVCTGTVEDASDNLLGLLLRMLYPQAVPPSEVVRYLRRPKVENLYGWYRHFWSRDLVERSGAGELAAVLDAMVGTLGHARLSRDAPFLLRTAPRSLVARILELSETVEPERLFRWLGLLQDTPRGAEYQAIRMWLSARGEIYKALTEQGLRRFGNSVEHHYEHRRRLCGAQEPGDFGAWCLARLRSDRSYGEWGEQFLLARVVGRAGLEKDLSPDAVQAVLADKPLVLERYRQRQRTAQGFADREKTLPTDADDLREARRTYRAHETALRKGEGGLQALHWLGSAYFGQLLEVSAHNDPRDRLFELVGEDEGLTKRALQALRASARRDDLPSAEEVLRLTREGRYPALKFAYLAALNEWPDLHVGRHPLDEAGMERALALLFTPPAVFGPDPYEAGWFTRIVAARPELVADSLMAAIRAQGRNADFSGQAIVALERQELVDVARFAVEPLLDRFPARGAGRQLGALARLMGLGRVLLAEGVFLALVEHKLSLKSLDMAQNIYWLGAGLLAAPESFAPRFDAVLAGRGRERRVRRLAEFLASSNVDCEQLDPATLELLVATVGGSYRPRPLVSVDGGAEVVTFDRAAHASELVGSMIEALASLGTVDAAEALARLGEDALLTPWWERLRQARNRQREIWRETEFRHPPLDRLQAALELGPPANAADLAAVTLEALRELAARVRHGNTNDWKQYWNFDGRHPRVPKLEEDCRDALLSDLRERLGALGVRAEPEGRYAGKTRADIRVSRGDYNVPVEVKRSMSPDLWTAIRHQLSPRYTRDPGAEGRGVFLVFWFGPEQRCPRPPSGARPKDAVELAARLHAQLSDDERRRIGVCVVDVSVPVNSASRPASAAPAA